MKFILSVMAAALLVAGCTTARVTESPPGSGNYSTNYVVDPRLEAGLVTAGAVNAATAPVNPFSPLVEIGLGAVAAAATWFAKRKNDQATQANSLLKVVVQGVENSDNADAKKAIQAHAVNVGAEGALNSAVAKINSGL